MPLLVLRDGRIGGERLPVVAVARVAAGVRGIAVVRVDDVAGRAAAGAVVAGMIVRAEEGEVRIVEPRLHQVDERGSDAQSRAAAAIAEADVGTPGLVLSFGVADLRRDGVVGDAAALEGAEVLARLRDLPVRRRDEERERPLGDLLRRRRRGRLERLRVAVAVVALAEEARLAADDAV